MSGAVRAGLIFGAIGLIAIVGTTFLPSPWPIYIQLLLAVLLGAAAGYYAVRWTVDRPRVSRGVLAGTLVGLGTLIGTLIAYPILFSRLSTNPLFQERVQSVLQQQPNAQF